MRKRNMRRALSMAGLALLPVLTLAPPASAAVTCPEFVPPADGEPKRQVAANLTGSQVVPPPGDPDGSGTVLIGLETVSKDTAKLTFQLSVNGISLPLTGAHVHKGAVGATGVAGLTLFTYSDQSDVSGTGVTMSKCSAHDIFQRPQDYYVDVHNYDYPDQGALRGQLQEAR